MAQRKETLSAEEGMHKQPPLRNVTAQPLRLKMESIAPRL